MDTAEPIKETRSKNLKLRMAPSEHEYIMDIARKERREVGKLVRQACDEYGQAHGFGSMPAVLTVRGRPPKPEDSDGC